MWDLPGPGLEPMSPALAGGFLTAVPSGKPLNFFERENVWWSWEEALDLFDVRMHFKALTVTGVQDCHGSRTGFSRTKEVQKQFQVHM